MGDGERSVFMTKKSILTFLFGGLAFALYDFIGLVLCIYADFAVYAWFVFLYWGIHLAGMTVFCVRATRGMTVPEMGLHPFFMILVDCFGTFLLILLMTFIINIDDSTEWLNPVATMFLGYQWMSVIAFMMMALIKVAVFITRRIRSIQKRD